MSVSELGVHSKFSPVGGASPSTKLIYQRKFEIRPGSIEIKWLSLLLCLIVWISSCTKEVSVEQDDDPPVRDTSTTNTDKPLLIRTVDYEEKYPEDSVTTDYYYNENNKLIRIRQHTVTSQTNISYEDDERLIYRNNDDIIQRLTVMHSHYESSTFIRKDSSVYDLVYDPVSKNGKYAIYTSNFDYAGTPYFIRDSIVYAYSNDKIVLMQVLRKDAVSGIFFEAERNEYAYDASGNIVTTRGNENYDNQGDPLIEYTYRYDDKINPFNFGMEGFLFGVDSYSIPTPNNILNVDAGPDICVYTYNADNLPVVQSFNSAPNEGFKRYFNYNK